MRGEVVLRLTMAQMGLIIGLWKGLNNMPEEDKDMTVVQTKYLCDVCGVGYMIPFGKLFVDKEQTWYPHQCDNCDNKVDYVISYPTINYVIK